MLLIKCENFWDAVLPNPSQITRLNRISNYPTPAVTDNIHGREWALVYHPRLTFGLKFSPPPLFPSCVGHCVPPSIQPPHRPPPLPPVSYKLIPPFPFLISFPSYEHHFIISITATTPFHSTLLQNAINTNTLSPKQ